MTNKNICRNPKCNKKIPENMAYCGQDCLQEHIKINKEVEKSNELNVNTGSGNIWLGQTRRKVAFKILEELVKELSPMDYKTFICHASYKTGLSLRKISDDYLEILLNTGIVVMNGNTILGLNKKAVQKLNGDKSGK